MLPVHHYAPAIFSVFLVECAQQVYALWLYAAVECWHWTTSMKSGVDLQPTSHYGGTLPAILTGLHELQAWCQKFAVMELGGAQQISQAGTKSLMSYSNFIWEGDSSYSGLLSGLASASSPFTLTVYHVSRQSTPGLATSSCLLVLDALQIWPNL